MAFLVMAYIVMAYSCVLYIYGLYSHGSPHVAVWYVAAPSGPLLGSGPMQMWPTYLWAHFPAFRHDEIRPPARLGVEMLAKCDLQNAITNVLP